MSLWLDRWYIERGRTEGVGSEAGERVCRAACSIYLTVFMDSFEQLVTILASSVYTSLSYEG